MLHPDGYKGRRLLHEAFILSVMLKGMDALLQVIGGVFLLLVSPASLSSWIMLLTRHELSEDPNDFIFSKLAGLAHDLSAGAQLFGAIYLLSHGAMKLVVVVSLLQRKPWAYPAMVILLVLFIVYQVYRYSYTHSFWLVWLTGFDIFLVVLTWVEYRRMKRIG